ncbi:hypothetical protein O181_099814 [Austropuccinia psidii MF-1]|uniref:Uncharacterized protein n=1 Tax=Austropuccinia psidii MF-1 TaxID=1389203 RepID=A0A9Q3JDE8_9BASI|nr:hypothetical protein [Austropuccinia psidii MF-1]
MLPRMVTLFLKLTGLEAKLLPEGGIEPIANLMKVESNPESLTTPTSRKPTSFFVIQCTVIQVRVSLSHNDDASVYWQLINNDEFSFEFSRQEEAFQKIST